MKAKQKLAPSSTQIILLSFLVTILIGSLLLFLPISAKSGTSVSYIDALFTATTATCVTGLVTLPTATTWSVFGQIVILLLIQIGGLGTITVLSGIVIALHRKMKLKAESHHAASPPLLTLRKRTNYKSPANMTW